MNISEETKKIVEIALKLENDGVKFYTDASNKTIHPLGKAVFKSFIEEEKKHIEKLKGMFGDVEAVSKSIKTKQGDPLERLRGLFQKMYAGEDIIVNPSADDLEAVRTAIDFEKDGNKLYNEAAAATTSAEKDIFVFLANEEDAHLTVLKNMLDQLEKIYKQEAKDEERKRIEWGRRLFMRSDAQNKKIV